MENQGRRKVQNDANEFIAFIGIAGIAVCWIFLIIARWIN